MSPKPSPFEAVSARKDAPETARAGIARRDLIGAAGLLLGGAGALAGAPQAVASDPLPSAGSPDGEIDGLTEHCRTYYRLARF